MNLTHLGDALDHWKGSLFEFLEREKLLRDFAADPMASDGNAWIEEDFELYARLLRIQPTQILHHQQPLADRADYFGEIHHRGDLFVDPDTGIRTSGCRRAYRYVEPQELVALLESPDGGGTPPRVVVVYQHVRGQQTAERVDACIRAVADAIQVAAEGDWGDSGWAAYESPTVAMLFLCKDKCRTEALAAGFRQWLGRHAQGRIRCRCAAQMVVGIG